LSRAGTDVTVYSVHPGAVKTDLQRHIEGGASTSRLWDWLFRIHRFFVGWKTPVHGAQTSIYCAIAPELEGVTGKYYE